MSPSCVPQPDARYAFVGEANPTDALPAFEHTDIYITPTLLDTTAFDGIPAFSLYGEQPSNRFSVAANLFKSPGARRAAGTRRTG